MSWISGRKLSPKIYNCEYKCTVNCTQFLQIILASCTPTQPHSTFLKHLLYRSVTSSTTGYAILFLLQKLIVGTTTTKYRLFKEFLFQLIVGPRCNMFLPHRLSGQPQRKGLTLFRIFLTYKDYHSNDHERSKLQMYPITL